MSQATPSFPDCECSFVIRTPKRRAGGHAAQLWGARGYWALGTFSTRDAARAAARAFAATDPVEPPPGTPRKDLPANWVRRRSDSHAPRYPFVRRVKGGAWQARPWLGPGGGSLNLGLFTRDDHGELAEWAAAQVAAAFVREWRGQRTVGEVVESLKRAAKPSERVPAHVDVPKRQRDLVRATKDETPPTGEQRAKEQSAELADRLRANLLGEPFTAAEIAASRAAAAERRRQDQADREQAIREGEPLDEIAELLAM